ncbi:MAG: DUF4491 family protein [Muribaculaceae bacterium]|nr:DUF4491 family protein [Muribaculaceae bacterium]MDE6559035.1 DUF4491 family protein [Muribaculaceae bacterium]
MEFLENYNLTGLVIGMCTFLIIGLFHPLVIKGEYYFGEKIKWTFAAGGVLFLVLALMVNNVLWSSISGVTAFSCFWSIKEISEQVERVRKGWFPANPKRNGVKRAKSGKTSE